MTTRKIIGGTVLAFLLSAGVAAAQTSTTSTTTVGTPNTGAGGSAANLILLGSTAALALAGLTYLSLSRKNLFE